MTDGLPSHMPDSAYRRLPDHVTMPLLTLVTRQSLDQDYAYVAQRRASGEAGPPDRRSVVWLVLVLVGFGVLVSTAAAQSSRDAAVDETSRTSLIHEIDAKREQLTALQDRAGVLQGRIAQARSADEEAAALDAQASLRLNRLQARTGYGPVRGAGVRITVDDAPGTQASIVRDSDLALLVDALWGVGAEAIAINGQRLTTLSAIRNVNVSIHVNSRPLAPPYVVEAIGDTRTLQADLLNSQRGQRFFALAGGLGLQLTRSNADDLDLPSAPLPALRYAAPTAGVDNGAADRKEQP